MAESEWAMLADDHPQATMKLLLNELGVGRADVGIWPASATRLAQRSGAEASAASARAALLRVALIPAEIPPAEMTPPPLDAESAARALMGLERFAFEGARQEAEGIALMLREALEIPGRTAALVTPDRDLARRTAAALLRHGIRVDDSAGQPLGETGPGTLLARLARAAAGGWEAVALIDLLAHPLVRCAAPRGRWRAQVRRFEREVLRGTRPVKGWAALGKAAAEVKGRPEPLVALIEDLSARVRPLDDAMADPSRRLDQVIGDLVAVAEALTLDPSGRTQLWQEEAGEAAHALLTGCIEAGAEAPMVRPRDLPATLDTLMRGVPVRPRAGTHPRLAILGPLEARLIRPDLIILGGLNEGSWPAEPAVDPWMSRPMRASFGLPGVERSIGLAAHDFQMALGAGEVKLTRAVRADGVPTVPSRWLLRIATVLNRLDGGLAGMWQPFNRYAAWAEGLDQPASVRPASRPAPTPPLERRPTRVSVTGIEIWRRDPYAHYARSVLHLRKLDPLGAEPDPAERGSLIHKIFERFLGGALDALPDNAEDELRALGFAELAHHMDHVEVWASWWPRFSAAADWFITEETRRRREGFQPVGLEQEGRLSIPVGRSFTLSAKADRIDRVPSGGLEVIDYKTGSAPRATDVRLGYAPQLVLEALMIQQGAFVEIKPGKVVTASYWKLSGGSTPGEVVQACKPKELAQLIDEAEAGLKALILAFEDPARPYPAQPHPGFALKYNDYAQLAREAEWSRADAPEGSS